VVENPVPTMSDLAVVVLAHSDPAHLLRLVNALEDLPVFVHCDAKTKPAVYGRMRTLPRRAAMLPRIDTRLSSWSLVAAELVGLRASLRATTADHIAVLSGADYPLVPVEELRRVLRRWTGHSYLYNRPLPFAQWNSSRRQDGGEWRMRYRFLTRRDNIRLWHGKPVRWPVRRSVPDGLELRASSQWKIYSREHAQLLLRVVDTRPDLIRFWRTSFTPDETFAASILSSPAIVGWQTVLRPCLANAWYYRFPPGASHPKWLDQTDFSEIAAARQAPSVEPPGVLDIADPKALQHAKLFARKFSSDNPSLLERIDAELRH
jgi:hypothetical protein